MNAEPTIGDIWDRLTADQQKKAFMLCLGIVEFYGDGDTWYATSLIADPPAGYITTDLRQCEDLGRHAPGGRARLALSWVISMFDRVSSASREGTVGPVVVGQGPSAAPNSARMCTCLGSCKGAAGLAAGWVCAIAARPALPGEPVKACRPWCGKTTPGNHRCCHVSAEGLEDFCFCTAECASAGRPLARALPGGTT